MRFEEAAIMLLAEQKHKTVVSITLTDKETGENIPYSLKLPLAPCQ